MSEHPFAHYVRILGKGKRGTRSLTETEAESAMGMILNEEVEPIQLGAFLMLLRVKEETPQELAGFARAVKAHIKAPTMETRPTLDWSSYAGKRRHPPWFVFSIVLLASNGYRCFVHGSDGHTENRIYTQHTFRYLGLPIANNWEEVELQLNKDSLSYLPLAKICPALETMIHLKSTLGLRSPVHSLSRLINPLDAPNVLQGIFHPSYQPLHQQTIALLGYRNAAVIKGEGGEIECVPEKKFSALISRDSKLESEPWDAQLPNRQLKPDSPSLNHMTAVWRGTIEEAYGISATITTTALALKLIEPKLTQNEAIEQSAHWWDTRDKNRFEKNSQHCQ